jgi:hypothetical protein
MIDGSSVESLVDKKKRAIGQCELFVAMSSWLQNISPDYTMAVALTV